MKLSQVPKTDQNALLRAFADASPTVVKGPSHESTTGQTTAKDSSAPTGDASSTKNLPAIIAPNLTTGFQSANTDVQKKAADVSGAAYGGQTTAATQGARVTSLVAFRMASFPPKGGVANLGDPPPGADDVAKDLSGAISDNAFAQKHGPALDLPAFQTDTEAYFGVYYNEKSGDLAVRKLVTGSSFDEIAMSVSRVEDGAQPGEKILGGFHNHPEGGGDAASKADMGAANVLAREIPGYQDFVLVGQDDQARLLPIDSTSVDIVSLDKDHLRFSSLHNMNREIRSGAKGTRGLSRADKAHGPFGQPHVHFNDNSAVNKDGSVKEGDPYGNMTAKNQAWLQKWGWNV